MHITTSSTCRQVTSLDDFFQNGIRRHERVNLVGIKPQKPPLIPGTLVFPVIVQPEDFALDPRRVRYYLGPITPLEKTVYVTDAFRLCDLDIEQFINISSETFDQTYYVFCPFVTMRRNCTGFLVLFDQIFFKFNQE